MKLGKTTTGKRRIRARAIPPARTRDSDIRSVLVESLRKRFSDSAHDLILQEFGCNSSRIDLAVVNGAFHGFENKSYRDSVDRLHTQIEEYGRVFDYVTLVCGRRLLAHARNLIPKWWGLQLADFDSGVVILKDLRSAKKNLSRDSQAVARMLWKTEALKALRKHGHRTLTSSHSAECVWNEAARLLDVDTLALEARDAIRSRGGSGFAKQSTPSDGSCTTESIGTPDHYSANLAWLLSQLSPHHPD
jgi:hypothetical protein